MRRYELMLLLRPDLEDDKLQAAVEKVTRAIVNGGGSLSKVSPWGKRRLAYDINRHREASYFLIHFDIEPAQVREIERGMLITEEILRHLVTVLEDRGTADELAPAAAARSLDGEFDLGDGDQPALEMAAASTALVATSDAPDDDSDDAAAEPAADDDSDDSDDDDTSNNDDSSEDASDENAEDQADAAPADEETVAADARTGKEPA